MKAIGIDIGIDNICGILIDAKTGSVEKSVSFSNDSFVHYRHSFQRIQEIRKIVNIKCSTKCNKYIQYISMKKEETTCQ